MHATERRGRSVKATAMETAASSNWSSPAAPADDMATTTEASSHSSAAAVIATTLRLPDQGRARKKRDPTEFSFHDFNFLRLFVRLFLKFIISLA
jgi:hypothetical protein